MSDPCSTDSLYTVYVIFHGLWGFELPDDKVIKARTPIEEMHDFQAGYFSYYGDDLIPHLKPIVPGYEELLGVTSTYQGTFDKNTNPIVYNHKFKRKSKCFATVTVPVPNKIMPLRNVQIPPTPMHPFAGDPGECLKPTSVPMVQLFIYTTYDPEGVHLAHCKAKADVSQETKTARLHLYAGPTGMVDSFHARDAYSKLSGLFANLDVIPVTPLFVKAIDENIRGLNELDMRTLAEMEMNTDSIMLGESGSNCDALVIDNFSKAST